jgi:hypothetical protein
MNLIDKMKSLSVLEADLKVIIIRISIFENNKIIDIRSNSS